MLPGIVKLGWVLAMQLPDFTSGVLPDSLRLLPTWINLAETATLAETVEMSGGMPIASTTLSFATSDDVPLIRIAFIACDAAGNLHIVGNRPPLCGVLKKEGNINTPDGDASTNNYTFTIPLPKYTI